MEVDYYSKYLKYKQKYIELKAQSNFAQGGSLKQKYIELKAQSNFAQGNSFSISLKQKYIDQSHSFKQSGGALCSVCHEDKPLIECPDCHFMKYCSPDCRSTDLARHTPKCAEIRDLLPIVATTNALEMASFRRVRDTGTSGKEKIVRTVAAATITDFYGVLNRKFNFPRQPFQNFKFKFPGWYRFPLDPTIAGIARPDDLDLDAYTLLRHRPIPLFSNPLDFSFATVPDGSTLKMECTAAFYMAQFALIRRLIPRMTEKILDIRVIDREIAKGNPALYPHEYNQDIEIATLITYLERGFLTPDDYDDINNILSHRKKIHRLYWVLDAMKHFIRGKDDIQLGDGCGIFGHPLYNDKLGSHQAENVYCVGFENEYPLFIGFDGHGSDGHDSRIGLSTPKTLDYVRKSLAREYIKQVEAREAISPEDEHIAYLTISTRPFIVNGGLRIEAFLAGDAIFDSTFAPAVVVQGDAAAKATFDAEVATQQSSLTSAELKARLGV